MSVPSFSTHVHEGMPQNYRELLAQDNEGIIPRLQVRGSMDIGPVEVPTDWYLSREIHELEVERLWKKTWQLACRASDIPSTGDTWVYDIANISVVVVRTGSGEVKAYYNSCLHRGLTLRKCSGRVANLQCPFHGFTWSLEGELRQIPSPEQFPDIKPEAFRLPEVKVGLWGGFVFINLDLDAAPLASFLGGFPDEFAHSPFDNRVKVVHVRKILPANWKAAQEAFMEGYHVMTTHPQQILMASDQCSMHDAFENYSRGVLARGVPSEYMSRTPAQQEVFDFAMGRWDEDDPLPPIGTGMTARQAMAARARDRLAQTMGREVADRQSVSELVDTIYYALFPNFHPFGSYLAAQVTTFRPHGDDHTRCEMDIMVLQPLGPGEKPSDLPPAPVNIIPEDQDFNAAPEMGFLSAFLNQDISNLGQIMKGMRNNQRRKVIFARQHELQIRHFYERYTKLMGLSAELST